MNIPTPRRCLLVLAAALGAALVMRSTLASAQDTPTETPTETLTETPTETPTATATPATCPQNLCVCLGAAAKFAVAGVDRVNGGIGLRREPYYHEIEHAPLSIDDSVCATKGRFTGGRNAGVNLGADLVLVQSTGIAGRFRGGNATYPFIGIVGDLITGGGSINGAGEVAVAGATDTTGTNPKAAGCRQALTDLVNASATLQSQTPTQTLPPIDVQPGVSGATYDIYAGPGVNVINVPSIRLAAPRGRNFYSYGSFLAIHVLDTTDSVIVNVAQSLSVGRNGGILPQGDPTKVIINVVGEGRKVSLGSFAEIDAIVLAPQRKVATHFGTTSANLFAKILALRGSDVTDELMCP
jgi:choice-of-anchor A domain-containing protein